MNEEKTTNTQINENKSKNVQEMSEAGFSSVLTRETIHFRSPEYFGALKNK